ncbi:hypothetical protein J5N97_013233 [Dioscorea zingiberensis]|uniref:Uncharacterized protein n=1 Tax=Dioscorea zingiberensis TaxID=325984 RepID=A0A9D5CRU0_9LILI|nr:hypothetical protein J5N97_013233 [Dioscorea zingiberensis]
MAIFKVWMSFFKILLSVPSECLQSCRKAYIPSSFACWAVIIWREFFYTVAFGTPHFDQMKGNKICKQIPWNDNEGLLVAWREGPNWIPLDRCSYDPA